MDNAKTTDIVSSLASAAIAINSVPDAPRLL